MAATNTKDAFICLQECRQWQHLAGRSMGSHFVIGRIVSGCLILIPMQFLGLVRKVYFGARHVGFALPSESMILNIISCRLIWDDYTSASGDVEAVETMDSVLSNYEALFPQSGGSSLLSSHSEEWILMFLSQCCWNPPSCSS